MPLTTSQLLSVFAVTLALLAAVRDVKDGLIPNRLVLAGALLGTSLQLAIGLASHGSSGALQALLQSAMGSVACALLPLGLYALGGLGGGDVKLFAALGVLTGPLLGLEAQLFAFAVGGLYAGARLAYEGLLLRALRSSLGLLTGRQRAVSLTAAPVGSIRFAPAICAGALLTTAIHWSSP